MKNFINGILLVVILSGFGHAAILSRVYLDDTQNVHIVTSSGKDLKVTTTGRRAEPLLSPDGETAAWVITDMFEGQKEPVPTGLEVYRQGKKRRIECEVVLRDFWFCQKSQSIAIDCGGLHFGGQEILYDIRTLKEKDRFDEYLVPTDKRPSWSNSSDHFDRNK